MKTIERLILVIIIHTLSLSLCSCGGKRIKLEPLSIGSYSDGYNGNVIEVPFKKQGGVRTIQVKINDCAEFPMIFDTGCSGVSISILELATLLKHGYISEDDVIGIPKHKLLTGVLLKKPW